MSQQPIIVCSFGEGRNGLPPGAEEVLHIGRGLAQACEAPLLWVILGSLPERASETAGLYGVQSLHHIDDAKLQEKREPLLAGPKGGHEKESPRR